MKNRILFLLLLACTLFVAPLSAQTFKLDVDGDAKITGNLDISNSADNLTSLYIGKFAGQSDPGTDGLGNVGVGFNALRDIISGENNTAVGLSTQLQNEEGVDNTSLGYFAMSNNVSGNSNTAVGANALGFGSQYSLNTAIGAEALFSSSTGSFNTAVGFQSMKDNTSGDSNAAIGLLSLQNNTTGKFNTAIGNNALETNTTGNSNTGLGLNADVTSGNLTNATAIGFNAKVSQSNSLVLGAGANVGIGTSSPSARLDVIGEAIFQDDNGIITLRSPGSNAFLSFENNGNEAGANVGYFNGESDAYYFVDMPGGVFAEMIIRNNGNIYQNNVLIHSDRRLKTAIKPVRDALPLLQQLRSVSYQMKSEIDGKQNIGLIAQEVETVLPQLVGERPDGYKAVNYIGIIPLLIKGMQEQQEEMEQKEERIESQESRIKSQEERIRMQEARIKNQEARLAQVEYLLQQLTINNSVIPNSTIDQQLPTDDLSTAKLYPNQPNPFSESTLIRYYLPQGSANAEVRIMNLEGKVIKTVPIRGSGEGQLTVNAQSLSAGTYLYSLTVDGELIATEKMVLLGKK